MSDRKVIRVSDEALASIQAYAEEKAITAGEAADKLIATAVGRRAALKAYTSTHPAQPKKAAKRSKAKRARAIKK